MWLQMNKNNIELNQNNSCSNCLALTVRKDYRLTIATNAIHLVKRMSWKISFSILLLNFFNMLF